jgi:hypothetical protein
MVHESKLNFHSGFLRHPVHLGSLKVIQTKLTSVYCLRLHSSYAFFTRAYTHVKVEFALHSTYEITKFIKGQHSVLCMI